jgi:hypothetical protein
MNGRTHSLNIAHVRASARRLRGPPLWCGNPTSSAFTRNSSRRPRYARTSAPFGVSARAHLRRSNDRHPPDCGTPPTRRRWRCGCCVCTGPGGETTCAVAHLRERRTVSRFRRGQRCHHWRRHREQRPRGPDTGPEHRGAPHRRPGSAPRFRPKTDGRRVCPPPNLASLFYSSLSSLFAPPPRLCGRPIDARCSVLGADGRIRGIAMREESPMQDGELVVRFFGMKDEDSSLHVAMKVIQGACHLTSRPGRPGARACVISDP